MIVDVGFVARGGERAVRRGRGLRSLGLEPCPTRVDLWGEEFLELELQLFRLAPGSFRRLDGTQGRTFATLDPESGALDTLVDVGFDNDFGAYDDVRDLFYVWDSNDTGRIQIVDLVTGQVTDVGAVAGEDRDGAFSEAEGGLFYVDGGLPRLFTIGTTDGLGPITRTNLGTIAGDPLLGMSTGHGLRRVRPGDDLRGREEAREREAQAHSQEDRRADRAGGLRQPGGGGEPLRRVPVRHGSRSRRRPPCSWGRSLRRERQALLEGEG